MAKRPTSSGTMFAHIRRAILKIPRGKVSTYGAIARAAGYPGAARQVVRALQQSHGLPWQRVVAAGGRIALPQELGLEQRFRLESEGVRFSGRRVRMRECEHKFPRTRPRKSKRRPSGGGSIGRRSPTR
ncbi:MAG TPA: MGMT family protein [Candidatus Angelobacter sp.]